MRLHEGAGVPGVLVAGDLVGGIVELVVAEDLGGGGVGGVDGAGSVEETVELIEVDGLGYVGGDAVVAGVDLWDAVDEDGEEDGDSLGLKLAGEGDGLGGSPTVAVEDDLGLLLFGGG